MVTRGDVTPYKQRLLDPLLPVEVYRNLSFPDGVTYSIRQNGLVIGHTREITLLDATFEVHEAGRQRVLRERRKNVHAWVKGMMVSTKPQPESSLDTRVTYNPYKMANFQDADGDPVVNARLVHLNKHGIWAWRVNDW